MNRRLLVDLEALAANYHVFTAAAQAAASPIRHLGGRAAVGGVVKANGYGVGARAVLERLLAEGCRHFFMATLEEALELRDVLKGELSDARWAALTPVERPELFIFDGVGTHDAADAAAAGLIPVLNDVSQLEAWRPHAPAPAALHFDTGMHRLGLPLTTPDERFADLNVTLVMSHLSCADQPEHPANDRQTKAFAGIVARFPEVRTSIGNSAGWLSGIQGDLGRMGIGLYGSNPFADRPSPVRPVASLQGRILQIQDVQPGEAVGYSESWTAGRPTRLATVAIGYADGVPRHLSGIGEMALADGRRCPIVGRISMDSTIIDLGAASEARVGDWVECFGAHIDVDDAAERAGTLGYELLTRVGARVPRLLQALR